MVIPLYSQRDPRWKDLSINGTTSTMELYGCTVTAISMLYSGSDPRYTPDVTLQYLESLGAFVNDLVLWTKTPFFRHRFYCTDSLAPIEEIKAELAQGKPVLLNVHFGSGNPYKPNHWVLAVDQAFTIHDPWTGEAVSLADRYGPPSKAILGGAYFDTMPSPAPAFPRTVTATANVHVRQEATTQSPIVGNKINGEAFQVIGQTEGELVDGTNIWLNTGFGYVSSRYIK